MEAKRIVNLTRGHVVCEHALIADQLLPRTRGLLGRRSLPVGNGLLLRPAPSVHTAFMRFPIDVVFVDGDLQVVKLVENLRPWRTAGARRARATLELATGQAAARGIKIGDQLALVTVDDHQGDVQAGAGSVSVAAVIDIFLAGNAEQRGPVNATEVALAHTRLLLVGKDRRFRSVAAALLTRHGYVVTLGERMADVAELAKRERADVVVIDAGSSLVAAAREAAQIQTIEPPVGVVVVRDEREEGLSPIPVLAKWGSFDELYDAIEHARPTRERRASNGQR